ncbi:ubiquitin thiolesterase [Colletotrichum tofieldiae]|nr:ubiquitin thiolesterase [Colletotrichum tofieldiae]
MGMIGGGEGAAHHGVGAGADMGDYSFSPTPLGAGAAGAMRAQAGSGAVAGVGSSKGMGGPLVMGGGGGGGGFRLGMGADMDMGLGLGSSALQSPLQSQPRPQSLSLGGEAAGLSRYRANNNSKSSGGDSSSRDMPTNGRLQQEQQRQRQRERLQHQVMVADPGLAPALTTLDLGLYLGLGRLGLDGVLHPHLLPVVLLVPVLLPLLLPLLLLLLLPLAPALLLHLTQQLLRILRRNKKQRSQEEKEPALFNFVAVAASSIAHSASARLSGMEPGDPSDLAAQEAAARDYQPHLEHCAAASAAASFTAPLDCTLTWFAPPAQGPLVGDKITSDAITDEYAKADDIYVAKTITYSHYRPIQGDGNCGWRAIGFSYFEHLVNNGDQHQILGEAARIQSLDQYLLRVGGYDRMLFEDMVEETITLLKDLAQNIANPQLAMHILAQRFNDQDASNAIIYHLRLLASSWLKGNPESYEPFIPAETGIAGYCGELERPNREIEHLGITLLVQVLLKPVNFVLEIAYLDRSPGSQVNIYRFPDEANGQDPANLGPIIYLLYRPDHYDILYKSPPNPAPLNLQVNRATSFSHRHDIASVAPSLHSYANLDYGPLAMLPGFGGPASGLSLGLSSLGSPTSTSPLPDAFDPPSHSPWLATPYSDHMQQQQPVSVPRPQPQTAPQPQPPTPAPVKPAQPVDYQLRFSHQCWHLNTTSSTQPSIRSAPSGFQEPSFTTAMFKNSHFNKAHYNNPHFHPEEWTPDDDGHHERVPSAKKKGKVRSDH